MQQRYSKVDAKGRHRGREVGRSGVGTDLVWLIVTACWLAFAKQRRDPVALPVREFWKTGSKRRLLDFAQEIEELKHGPRRKKPRIGFYTGESK